MPRKCVPAIRYLPCRLDQNQVTHCTSVVKSEGRGMAFTCGRAVWFGGAHAPRVLVFGALAETNFPAKEGSSALG